MLIEKNQAQKRRSRDNETLANVPFCCNAPLFVLLLLLLPIAAGVEAAEFRISSFGTLGVSCFSNDDADYAPNEIPDGPGRSSTCDMGMDSKLGLQADLEITDRLSATLQATAYHRADDSYTPEITLANLRWKFLEDFTLRLGRVQNPNFLYSEYRNVHYAQPWARPPPNVYSVATTFLHDGAELLYTVLISGWELELQAGIAKANFDAPRSNASGTDEVETDPRYLTATLDRGEWLLKAGYSTGLASYQPEELDLLFDTLRSTGFSDLADDLEIDDKRFKLYSLGIQYDDGHWLAVGEYAHRTSDGWYRNQDGAYLTLGRRMESWMLYGTVSRRWTDGPESDDTIPRGVDPLLDVLADSVNELLVGSKADNTSVALGVSRELNDYLTIKGQVEWIHPDDGSHYYFNHAPDYDYDNPGDDVLFSLNLDFVY